MSSPLGEGGGVLPYISLMGMYRPIGVKMGIDFSHFKFGLESDMVFKGTTVVCERIYRFNSKRLRNKEKYATSK